MAKTVPEILAEAEQLNEKGELDKSTIEDVANEIAYAIEEGGGFDDMDKDDVMELIGMFLEDVPGAEGANEDDMIAIYKRVEQKFNG